MRASIWRNWRPSSTHNDSELSLMVLGSGGEVCLVPFLLLRMHHTNDSEWLPVAPHVCPINQKSKSLTQMIPTTFPPHGPNRPNDRATLRESLSETCSLGPPSGDSGGA